MRLSDGEIRLIDIIREFPDKTVRFYQRKMGNKCITQMYNLINSLENKGFIVFERYGTINPTTMEEICISNM